MNDYISREAVREIFTPKNECVIPVMVQINAKAVLQAIDNIPAADVAPVVHGRWIMDENGVVKCDKCGGHPPFYMMATTYKASKFCPDCGARMDGDADA